MMSIILYEFDMDIDLEAFAALPITAQEYLETVVKKKWAKINGWTWCEINWDSEYCVKLCFTGSPARDIGVTWVYNTQSKQFEERLTQYHLPVSLIKILNTYSTFEEFLFELKALTYHDLDAFLE